MVNQLLSGPHFSPYKMTGMYYTRGFNLESMGSLGNPLIPGNYTQDCEWVGFGGRESRVLRPLPPNYTRSC